MATTKIVISGEIRLDPDDFDAALALIEPLVAATHQEPGCIAYDFWVDPHDRGRVRVFEEWESAEANASHAESEHLAVFFAALGSIRITSAELHRFDVTSKAPL